MYFPKIARDIIKEYAEGFQYSNGIDYANHALFISLDKDFNATISVSSSILQDAYQALIILVRDEVAITNSYWWYELRYIDPKGVVYDYFDVDGWKIKTYCSGKYTDQMISLSHNEKVWMRRELDPSVWINTLKEIFDYFSVIRKASTDEEILWMGKYLKAYSKQSFLEKKNLLLEKKIAFLEQQVEKYTALLNRFENLLNQYSKNNSDSAV